MSGALDRLVRRVRGTLPSVEPVLPSRWEQPGEQAGLTETHSEIEARAATPEPMARRVLPVPGPAPTQPGDAERPRPAERSVRRKAEPPTEAQELPQPPATHPDLAARPGDAASARLEAIPNVLTPASATRHDDANRDRSPRPAMPDPVPEQPSRQPPPTRAVVPPGDPRSRDDRASMPPEVPQPRHRPAPRWPETAASAPQPPAPTAPEPSAPQSAATGESDAGLPSTPQPVAPRPAPPALARSPAGPRDVHVTIGRVEVHPPPRPAEPVRAPAAARPRISLEDYQRQRRERGR